AYDSLEGSTGAGLPTLAVSGALEDPLVVIVMVTGGTAVLGEDYLTPGGGTTFTVSVPAGVYDGTEAIALGLTAPGNSEIDGSRTVELQLQPDPSNYFTRSTSECGGAGATEAVWTILDDDLDLAIEKTAGVAAAAPGDTIDYTLVVSHLGGVPGDGSVVRDP